MIRYKERVIKKFINCSIAGFVIVGFFLILGKDEWFPEFYMRFFMGAISFLSALVIILPCLIFKSQEEEKEKALVNLQSAMALGLILNGLGGLGLFQLYKLGIPYDKIIHFTVAFLLMAAITNFIYMWYEKNLNRVFAITFIIVIGAGFVWEFLEFFSDTVLQTRTLGIYGMDVIRDTILDIILNFLGAFLAMLIVAKSKFQYPKKQSLQNSGDYF